MNGYQFDFQRKPRRRAAIKLDEKTGIYQRPILEEDVVKEIVQRLGYAKFKVFRHKERIPVMYGKKKHFAGHASTPGIPDLFGWIPVSIPRLGITRDATPMPFFIEVKRPGKNHHRPAQIEFIRAAREDGVIAFFAESWLDVLKGFEEGGIVFK